MRRSSTSRRACRFARTSDICSLIAPSSSCVTERARSSQGSLPPAAAPASSLPERMDLGEGTREPASPLVVAVAGLVGLVSVVE